jgi:hypothetical protein
MFNAVLVGRVSKGKTGAASTKRKSRSWSSPEMERHMLSIYRAIMDPSINPLRNLPAAQRFQTMLYLSVMWTTVFCAAAGAWVWYGEIVVAHLLVAAGFVVTGLTFRAASHSADRGWPLRVSTGR